MMLAVINGRKTALILAVLIVVQLCIAAGVCLGEEFKQTSLVDFTVVIDAGHGGMDGGVVGSDGTKEAELNLAYANTLGEKFATAGFNVVYTRRDANGLYGLPTRGFKRRDMLARKAIVDNARPNLVISVHMNKYSDARRSGAQVFYQQGNADGKLFADSLQACFNEASGSTHEALGGDYFICREVSCPSVIVECGFVSSPSELALLKTDDYRSSLCDNIFKGTMLFLCRSE